MNSYQVGMREVITIRKDKGNLLVQGKDQKGEIVSCIFYTNDVEKLWHSIQRARTEENLRTLREDRLERIKRGRLC